MTTSAKIRPCLSLQVFFDAEDHDASAHEVCTEELVQQCCLAALEGQSVLDLQHVAQAEVSVQIVSTEVMQALNVEYRQKQGATNVLSFESGLPVMPLEGDLHNGGLLALGDLVLCRDVIAREAQEQFKDEVAHWAHMLVHGTLHLCGYDHEEEHQASAMENLEIQILSRAGYADPYGSSE